MCLCVCVNTWHTAGAQDVLVDLGAGDAVGDGLRRVRPG